MAIRPFDISTLLSKDRMGSAGEGTVAPLVAEQVSKLSAVSREQELLTKMVCLLVANGESMDVVAKKLTLPVREVHAIAGRPESIDMIVRFQADGGKSVVQRVKSLAQIAVDVQTQLLLDPKTAPTIKAKVAQEVIDRAEGKAIQVTENRNLNFDLKDAAAIDRQMVAQMQKLERIEQMQRKLAIDVPSHSIKST